MSHNSTFKTGFEPVVHLWTCAECKKLNKTWSWTITVNPLNPLDKLILSNSELQVSNHVLMLGHEIIHKTKNEVFKTDL